MSTDRSKDLEGLASQFDERVTMNERALVEALSHPDAAERRRCADWIRKNVIPALADDPDAESRVASKRTLSRLIAELRPPDGRREVDDFRNAVEHLVRRDMRWKAAAAQKAAAPPKTGYRDPDVEGNRPFAVGLVVVFLLVAGLSLFLNAPVQPLSSAIGAAVTKGLVPVGVALAPLVWPSNRRKSKGTFLVSGIVVGILVGIGVLNARISEATSEAAGLCAATTANWPGKPDLLGRFCECTTEAVAGRTMWSLSTSWALGRSDDEVHASIKTIASEAARQCGSTVR